ncbi:methylamine utilization protein [Aquabacterium sp. NJ1]|uniref:methylamine utilization protein n=1 Tax=Aquabacterium sp. NJ1 TaxID=1538295 RepID=UPI00068C2B0D|nr:methylamine utilization protein [Aquabacterium sp. NJ1]
MLDRQHASNWVEKPGQRAWLGLAATLLCLSAWAAPQQIQLQADNGQPLAGAAVSVFVKGTRAQAAPGTVADMAQKDKAFVPKLRVIQTGTSVNFPNFDTVRHHVYSFSPTKTFEIKLYAGTPAAPVVFDKPGTATLGCNIHDRMLGYVHVVDTPYFGVTDAGGNVSIDIPPGEHRVRVWVPSMGEASPGVEQAFKTSAEPIVIRLKP